MSFAIQQRLNSFCLGFVAIADCLDEGAPIVGRKFHYVWKICWTRTQRRLLI
jgi:hypothetical protein